jgi:integrase/recombinase XerD
MELSKALEYFTSAVESNGNVSKREKRRIVSVLNLFTKNFAEVQIEDISVAELTEYANTLRNGRIQKSRNTDQTLLSESALRDLVAIIRFFFDFCQKTGIVPASPAKDFYLPRIEPRTAAPIRNDEFTALMASAVNENSSIDRDAQTGRVVHLSHLRNTAILLILRDSGIRAGEFTRLVVGDFDASASSIRVKAGKYTQKGTDFNSVPLRQEIVLAIQKYLAARAEALDRTTFADGGLETTAPLFVSGKGEQAFSTRGLTNMLSDLSIKAGIRHIQPFLFRKTFAVEYLRKGGNDSTRQEILGLSDIDLCRRKVESAKAVV